MSQSKFDMFKDAPNGEHTRFIAEKLRSIFAVKGEIRIRIRNKYK